jgi:hypothetical protein
MLVDGQGSGDEIRKTIIPLITIPAAKCFPLGLRITVDRDDDRLGSRFTGTSAASVPPISGPFPTLRLTREWLTPQ